MASFNPWKKQPVYNMGGNGSKPEETSLLDKEWRPVPWTDKAKYLEYVRGFEPFLPHNDDDEDEVQHIRILLHGPVGQGRSSFINTVESVLRGRMTVRALVDAAEEMRFTRKYTTYKIKKGPGTFYPFVFSDTMGVEKDLGVREEDIRLAMKGHVKDGYRFSPDSSLSKDDQYYNTNPSLSDRTHVLVYVVSAFKLHLLDDNVMKKVKIAREEASDKDIPQMVILTHIDEACPEVHADLTNVYKSLYVKEQMEVLSASLGVPLNCIFPVKNYHSEIDPDNQVEILTLMALKHMINLGEDFVNDCKEN